MGCRLGQAEISTHCPEDFNFCLIPLSTFWPDHNCTVVLCLASRNNTQPLPLQAVPVVSFPHIDVERVIVAVRLTPSPLQPSHWCEWLAVDTARLSETPLSISLLMLEVK